MHSSKFKSERGSVLLTAMLFSLALAIFLTSYMQISVNALKLANRSFYSNAAMDLSDLGLEQAMWGMNNGWTNSGLTSYNTSQYRGTFGPYNLSGGVTGKVNVWVNPTGANPEAVAQAIITLPSGGQIIKEAEMFMKNSSYFSNGLVAKNTITFRGNNATVDSWNSDPSGTVIPYSSTVAHDSGQIGSTSVQTDSINVSNADIYGYAEVGGSAANDIQVGPQGRVGPYGTASGTIDQTRVNYDFTTSFPDQATPTADTYKDPSTGITTSVTLTGSNTNTISAISGSKTLPAAGDKSITINGVTTYYYYLPSISLTGNTDTLTIGASSSAHANVVIMTTNTTGTTVNATGNHSGISIATNSTLAIYTAGNVSMTGNGVLNGGSTASTSNQPSAFQLYGTRSAATAASTGEQSIEIKGNGSLSGVVYAPNADITIDGNGDVLGSAVGNSVTLTGNAAFHYDESLKTTVSSGLYTLSKWRELYTSSDQNTYASNFSGL